MRRILAVHLFFIILVLIAVVSQAGAEDALLKPYVLASNLPGTIDKKLADVKAAVGQAGFRVDLPNKQESVFGVGLSEGDGADAAVMKVTDSGDPKHTAHLPYELVVSRGAVYMLHGKFRIAASFPDLTMGTFMKISGAPSAIEEKLKLVAGAK